jgi:Mg-chelatase subunit ChlD
MSFNSNAKNIIMLITDGDPSVPKTTSPEAVARLAARKAKALGTFIIPVMIAQTLDTNTWQYMKDISSDGTVFNVSDFSSLDTLQETLITQVSCQV